jgi:hypothetical protein
MSQCNGFDSPEYVANVDGLGTLEGCSRLLGLTKKQECISFYSEMYGRE